MMKPTKLAALVGIGMLLSVTSGAVGPNIARRRRLEYTNQEVEDLLHQLPGLSSVTSRRRLPAVTAALTHCKKCKKIITPVDQWNNGDVQAWISGTGFFNNRWPKAAQRSREAWEKWCPRWTEPWWKQSNTISRRLVKYINAVNSGNDVFVTTFETELTEAFKRSSSTFLKKVKKLGLDIPLEKDPETYTNRILEETALLPTQEFPRHNCSAATTHRKRDISEWTDADVLTWIQRLEMPIVKRPEVKCVLLETWTKDDFPSGAFQHNHTLVRHLGNYIKNSIREPFNDSGFEEKDLKYILKKVKQKLTISDAALRKLNK